MEVTEFERAPVRALDLRGDLVRTLLLLLALLISLGGLSSILAGFGWWVLCAVLVILILGGGLATRSVLRSNPILARIIGPVVGLVLAAIAIMFRFSAGTAILYFFPTDSTFRLFGKLVRDAGYSITWQSVPATADEGISFLLALGTMALVLIAEISASSLRLPALVGLPMAAIFLVPSATPDGKTSGWFFAASAIAFLALLFHGRLRQLVPAAWIAATAVICGLVIPPFLPSTEATTASSTIGPSVATGVNPIIKLGDDLRSREAKVALSYSTVSGKPEYLRLTEISSFSGQQWGPERPMLDPDNRPVDFPRPPGLVSGVSTTNEVSYIQVDNLLSPWLPVPYPATRITGLTGGWSFVPESFTVASNDSLARSQVYTVQSVVLTPTPEQLLAAGTSVPAELSKYLRLPADAPAVIGETARQVTGGDSSNYEKALALQEFLRSSPFVYSESAPVEDGYDGTGVQIIAKFLEEHRGYCIHFASAMAVMARELGIPSRLIVGFQPGSARNGLDSGRKVYDVTNKDLHAWPELYFSGIGWVRFEPTPSRGSVPDYANQQLEGVPSVTAGSGNSATPNPQTAGRNPELSEGVVSTPWLDTSNPTAWITVGAIGTGLILLIIQPLLVRSIRRKRRFEQIRSGRAGAVLAWTEVQESAEDLGLHLGENLTVREAADHLKLRRGIGTDVGEAIDRIRNQVELAGYGPQHSAVSSASPELVADLRVLLRALRQSSEPAARFQAVLLPKSLLSRIVSQIRRFAW